MGGQMLRLIVGFVVGAWLTRSLGVDATGVLGTILSAGSMFGFAAEFGLRQILIKEMSAVPERVGEVFGTGFRLLAIMGLCSFALGTCGAWLLGGTGTLVTVVLAFSPLLFNPHIALLARWDARHEARRGAQLGLMALIVAAAAKVATILLNGGINGAAAAIAVEGIFVAVAAVVLGARMGWLSDCAKIEAATAKRLMGQAWPHFAAHCGTLLLLRLDQWMLLPMRGSSEAGIYAAATRLSELVYMAGPVMVLTFLPRLTAQFQNDPVAYRRQCGAVFGIMSCLGYAVMAFWWLAGPQVVRLVYGPEFAASAPVLAVHCVAALPSLHGSLITAFLVVEGRAKLGALACYVGVLMNACLNLWWIPAHGALGAAWATALTYFFVWFGGPLLLRSIRPLFVEQMRSLVAPLTLPLNWRESLRPLRN